MSGLLVICCENHDKAADYVDALVALGVPSEKLRVVTPDDPGDAPKALAHRAAGVVLCGGPDLDPALYGEERITTAEVYVDTPLDRLDWEILEGARDARTPVWAICRGLQVLNVFLGGSLWQDIPSQLESQLSHQVGEPLDAPAHGLEVSRRHHPLSEPLRDGSTVVNSRHHQALKELAAGLEVLARAEDGVVEVAALVDRGWWAQGVQWHPENLVGVPVERALWRQFLVAAGSPAAPA